MTRTYQSEFASVRILGISGLANAKRFKRSQWPGLDEREYSISPGLDVAAALVIDGGLVALKASEAEERSSGKQAGGFPIDAVQDCLAEANLTYRDIDTLVHAYDYSAYEELYLLSKSDAAFYREVLSGEALWAQVHRYLPKLPTERVRQVPHHLAHAAGAYFPSGWTDCAVLVVDGLSEGQGVTSYFVRGGHFEEIKEIVTANSIGVLLGLVAMHLGFAFQNAEDKVVRLALDGDPDRFRPFFELAVQLARDGSILIPPLWRNKTRRDQEFYLETRRYLTEYLGPARLPSDEVLQRHRDIAAALQECLGRVLIHCCRYLRLVTGLPRIAIAGDIALNYGAGRHLLEAGVFEEVFEPDALGDDGAAVGAALLGALAGIGATRSLVAGGDIEAG
jgi:carbamoyltransferase